jgi:uncharacterized protein YndB with AHSA1/START domain
MPPIENELAIERHIADPAALVWNIWTERLEEWWVPRPWTTKVIEINMRPGGRLATIMSGPDGGASPMESVFPEPIPGRKIVLIDAYAVGWVPQPAIMT